MGVGKPRPGNEGHDNVGPRQGRAGHDASGGPCFDMLTAIESVQERTVTLVSHALTTRCLGSSALTGQGLPSIACVCGFVFLDEEIAMTTPALDRTKRSEGWFLDTGALNHMTSSVDVFAELDRSSLGRCTHHPLSTFSSLFCSTHPPMPVQTTNQAAGDEAATGVTPPPC